MLFLGVDGGGTKTHAVLADESGAVQGVGETGPSNWEGIGVDGTYRALQQVTAETLAHLGAAPADVTAACYGLGGIDWPSDEERLRPTIERLGVGGPQVLLNDTFVALRAGAPYGVVVIAGTGATVAGRNRKGATARTLGLGWWLDDWGSAPEVATACVRAVAAAYTGHGPATALTGRLVRLFGAQDDADLLEGLSRDQYSFREKVAEIIGALSGEAEAGDEVAIKVSQYAGRELGERAAAVAQRLGMEKEMFDVVLAGGLFRTPNTTMLSALRDTVQAVAPAARLLPLQVPPVVGSVLLAMEAAGLEPTEEARRRLTEETNRRLS